VYYIIISVNTFIINRIELNEVYDEWLKAAEKQMNEYVRSKKISASDLKDTPKDKKTLYFQYFPFVRYSLLSFFLLQLVYETVSQSEARGFVLHHYYSFTISDVNANPVDKPNISSLITGIFRHIKRFCDVSDGIHTWFFGACAVVIEILRLYMRYDGGRETASPSSIFTFFAKRIPTVSFLFVFAGAVHFLLDNVRDENQQLIGSHFQVDCISTSVPSLRSVLGSYLRVFSFSRDIFFWGTMRFFLMVGAPQEVLLGSFNFALLIGSIIFVSHSLELLLWVAPQLVGSNCIGPLITEVGFSNIIFGLIFIDHIMSLRKIHAATNDSMTNWIDYILLTGIDILLLVTSTSWPFAYFFLTAFTLYAMFSPYMYDRIVKSRFLSDDDVDFIVENEMPIEDQCCVCIPNFLNLSFICPVEKTKSSIHLCDRLNFSLPNYMVPVGIVAKCLSPSIVPFSIVCLCTNAILQFIPWFELCFSLAVVHIFDIFWFPSLIDALDQSESKKVTTKPRHRHWFTFLDQLLIPFIFIRATTGGSDVGHLTGLLAGLISIVFVYQMNWIGSKAMSAAVDTQCWAKYEKCLVITPDFIPLMLLVDDTRHSYIAILIDTVITIFPSVVYVYSLISRLRR